MPAAGLHARRADYLRSHARSADRLMLVWCPDATQLGRRATDQDRGKTRRAAIRAQALLARASQQLYLPRHRLLGGVFAFGQT